MRSLKQHSIIVKNTADDVLRNTFQRYKPGGKDVDIMYDALMDTFTQEEIDQWHNEERQIIFEDGQERGRKEGYESGREDGIEEGRENSILETMYRMFYKNVDVDQVADLLDRPEKEVLEHRKFYAKNKKEIIEKFGFKKPKSISR